MPETSVRELEAQREALSEDADAERLAINRQIEALAATSISPPPSVTSTAVKTPSKQTEVVQIPSSRIPSSQISFSRIPLSTDKQLAAETKEELLKTLPSTVPVAELPAGKPAPYTGSTQFLPSYTKYATKADLAKSGRQPSGLIPVLIREPSAKDVARGKRMGPDIYGRWEHATDAALIDKEGNREEGIAYWIWDRPAQAITYPTTVVEPEISKKEQDLRESITPKTIAKVEAGLEEGESLQEYRESVADVKAKVAMIDQANEMKQSYQEAGIAVPPEVQQSLDQIQALTLSPISPFIHLTPEGEISLTTSLSTIIKAGVTEKDIKKAGFDKETIQELKTFEKELKEAEPSLLKTYEQGGIDAYNKAISAEQFVSQQERTRFEKTLQKESPELYKIYREGGLPAYNKALATSGSDFRQKVNDIDPSLLALYDEKGYLALQTEFDRREKEWLEALDPKYKTIFEQQGKTAMEKAIDADIATFEADLQKQDPALHKIYQSQGTTAYNAIVKELKKSNPDAKILAQYLPENTRKLYQDSSGQDKFSLLRDTGLLPPQALYRGKDNQGNPQIGWGTGLEHYLMSATPAQLGIFAAEVVVPGVFIARQWNKLSASEKAVYLGLDALSLVFIGGAITRGARAGAAFGRTATLKGAARGLGTEAVAQLRAPIDILVHPIGATKATVKGLRDLAENIAHPKRIPFSTITTSESLVSIKVHDKMSEAEAQAAVEILTEKAIKGEKLIVNTGEYIIELPSSALMKEVRGGLANVSADIRPIKEGSKVIFKEGLPANEQGWFLSHEPATQFIKGSALGKETIPVPITAKEKVWSVAEFRADNVVRVDKQPIRVLSFADAENVPSDLAKAVEKYATNNQGRVYGSMNEWLKIKGAKRPQDIDLAFPDQKKAMTDILNLARGQGYEARLAPHSVEIFYNKQWIKLGDIASITEHNAMIPKGLAQPAQQINGIRVENLGEQYLRQSYGAVAKGEKALERTKRLEKAANDVKQALKQAGFGKMKPGIIIVRESAIKAVPTKKIWKKRAEIERKFIIGADIPKPKQWLFTRIGTSGKRVEIGLETPLKTRQIAKLKATGLVETIKAPFQPAIRVRRLKANGLNSFEVNSLGRQLRQAGYIDQADDLLRIERVFQASRPIPKSLSAITGRVSRTAVEKARERLEKTAVTRGKQERIEGFTRPERLVRTERIVLVRRPERLLRAPISRIGRPPRIEMPRLVTREARPIRLKRTERPERPTRVTRAERPIRTARVERPVRATRTERLTRERVSRPERLSRIERLPRERITRIERPTRLEPPTRLKPPTRLRPPTQVFKEEKEKKPRGELVPITWRQGFVWYTIKPPYRSKTDVAISRTPPGGARLETGLGSAYKTIQRLGGDAELLLSIDLGIQDIEIRGRKTGKPTIGYKRDIRQRTRGDISLKGVRL